MRLRVLLHGGGRSFDAATDQHRMFAQRWNGASFSAQPIAHPPGLDHASLIGVSCTSPTFCTAVGSSFAAEVAQFLGRTWDGTPWGPDSVPLPAGGIGSGGLRGVSCTGSSSCTAVGDRNGTEFVALIR